MKGVFTFEKGKIAILDGNPVRIPDQVVARRLTYATERTRFPVLRQNEIVDVTIDINESELHCSECLMVLRHANPPLTLLP